MIPEAPSAEEAAEKAVLLSELRHGCIQASWIQQLCDSNACPPSSQHTLKTGEKGSCKIVFLLFSLNSSFRLSIKNVQCFLLIPLLAQTPQFSISGMFQTLLGVKKT